MKILIIGSGGFIGSHLVEYFHGQGFDVYGCDIQEKRSGFFTYFRVEKSVAQWGSIFSQHIYDFCINAAGNGNVNYSVSHPFEDFESNTLDTAEILDAIRKYNPSCRYLHISSAAVYGNPLTLPVSESDPCKPLSPYGWHKWMAEQLCHEYVQVHHLSIAIVRPFSIYGPGLRKQLFWDTYQKYLSGKSAVELWGTGYESRDFIYIDDVVRCLHHIMTHAAMQGDMYNLASGQEITVSEAVSVMFRHLSVNPAIKFNNKVREGDPLNWRADITKLSELGFAATTSFEEGISKLATWLRTI